MRLEIAFSSLYADELFICHVGAGNGRDAIPVGRYSISPTYSHAHGKNLPLADGLGWVGASQQCDVVLGSVRARHGVIPHGPFETKLFALLEAADERGQSSELVVK